MSKRSWQPWPDHHTTGFHLPLREDMVTMSPYLEQKKRPVWYQRQKNMSKLAFLSKGYIITKSKKVQLATDSRWQQKNN